MNFSEVIFGDGRWVYLWHGLEVTLVLTVLSVALGVIIGIIIALMRVSKIRREHFRKYRPRPNTNTAR
jgi:arginine/lysine/histidine transport system permease protein